jgi:hypothetical protein
MPTSSRNSNEDTSNVSIRKETVGQKLDRFIDSIYHEASLVKESVDSQWRLIVIIILSISSLLIIGKFYRGSFNRKNF